MVSLSGIILLNPFHLAKYCATFSTQLSCYLLQEACDFSVWTEIGHNSEVIIYHSEFTDSLKILHTRILKRQLF